MARFITRIQLQQASEDDYKNLQKELTRASFKSAGKQSKKGKLTGAENGEFSLEGNVSIQQVTNAVVKAITRTGKKFSFTIVRDKSSYN